MKITMLKTGILIISTLLLGSVSFCHSLENEYTITGNIKGASNKTITLSDTFGKDHRVVKTSTTDKEVNFRFVLTGDSHPGLYRVELDEGKYIEFIFNSEDIILNTSYESPNSSLKFVKSRENLLFTEYTNRNILLEQKYRVLGQALVSFPKDDSFYKTLRDEFNRTSREKDEFYEKFIDSSKGTYACKMIQWLRTTDPDPGLSEEERKEFYVNNVFNAVDFLDTEIIYTGIIPAKIKEYILLNESQQQITKPEYEQQLIFLVDDIMHLASINTEVKGFVTDLLLDLFKNTGLETVYTHIADTYFEVTLCEAGDDNKGMVQKRSEAFKRLAVGKVAPDIVFPGDGSRKKLSDNDFKYALILFWSTTCPTCKKLIPRLVELNEEYSAKGLRVFPVSLDRDKADLDSYLDKNSLPWPVFCDYQGWEGEIAGDYFVYATPTMFLLSSNLEILAKPISVFSLEKDITRIIDQP